MDELAQMDADLEALAKAQRETRSFPPLPATSDITPVVDEQATKAKGRTVWKDIEQITIRVGAKDTVDREVTSEDKQTYATQYVAWKKGESVEPIDGFPLAQWAMIPGKAVVKDLAYYGIRSIEQLAACTDATLQKIGPYIALRQLARDWVANADKQAPVAKLREELAQATLRIRTLEDMLKSAAAHAQAHPGATPTVDDPRIVAMQAQIAQLAAALAPKVEDAPSNGTPKRRPGRPPGGKNKPKDPTP